MLSNEKRKAPYPSREVLLHLVGPRGKKYFPHCIDSKERYEECKTAILDPSKGVIVPDIREDSSSTHICLFINGANENIALPLGIDDNGKISIITIKNIAESEQDPAWFYDEYNRIAQTRSMPIMNRIWRPATQ